MPTIRLTKGQRSRVDWCDYRHLVQFRWHARWCKNNSSFYAGRGSYEAGSSRTRTVLMHREILNLSNPKIQIDHKNRNTLDNRRSNLRICNNRKNQENRRDQSAHGVGVYFKSSCKMNPFWAQAMVNKKQVYVGSFQTPEEAQEARKQFLKTING